MVTRVGKNYLGLGLIVFLSGCGGSKGGNPIKLPDPANRDQGGPRVACVDNESLPAPTPQIRNYPLHVNGKVLEMTQRASLLKPRFNKLMSFLRESRANEHDYIEPYVYVCADFAYALYQEALALGLDAKYMGFGLSGQEAGHAVVAFETSDRGRVLVDFTGGKAGEGHYKRLSWVQPGEHYLAVDFRGLSPCATEFTNDRDFFETKRNELADFDARITQMSEGIAVKAASCKGLADERDIRRSELNATTQKISELTRIIIAAPNSAEADEARRQRNILQPIKVAQQQSLQQAEGVMTTCFTEWNQLNTQRSGLQKQKPYPAFYQGFGDKDPLITDVDLAPL